MRIRQLTAGDYHGPGQRKMQAKIARGICAVSVDAGEMPQLPAWFTYTIGTFDRKRITLSPAPSGAKRGYKSAARDLLLKAQRDHEWPALLTPAEARKQASEAKARAKADPVLQERASQLQENIARQRAEAPMVRRFDATANHPLTYTHPTGAVAWLRKTTFRGVPGFRMMVAPALGRAAQGEGTTVIADLSDAANQLDAIVAARFGDNWTPAEP